MKYSNRYKTYDQYLTHQAEKSQRPYTYQKYHLCRKERVAWFMSRFKVLRPTEDSVLCLGARYGEEVKAFRKLGFPSTIGIDLVEYPPLVIKGDMHDLHQWYNSISIVYTNVFDHCWKPNIFISEIHKVLKIGGIVFMHLTFGLGDFETVIPEEPEEVIDIFSSIGHYSIISDIDIEVSPVVSGVSHEIILEKVS